MKDEIIMKDGKSYKIAQVVMLPTEKVSSLKNYWIGNGRISNVLHLIKGDVDTDKCFDIPQNLYILFDEEIKEGDWFIRNSSIEQCYKSHENDIEFKTKKNSVYCGTNTFWNKKYCKKIIATTDESLKIYKEDIPCDKGYYVSLPRPSDDFLKAFVKAKGKITEVLVEYEYKTNGTNPICIDYDSIILKISPDNTITIKPVKIINYTGYYCRACGEDVYLGRSCSKGCSNESDNLVLCDVYPKEKTWNRKEVKELMESWMVLPKTPESISKWIKENL